MLATTVRSGVGVFVGLLPELNNSVRVTDEFMRGVLDDGVGNQGRARRFGWIARRAI
jgi:hypothetical protein